MRVCVWARARARVCVAVALTSQLSMPSQCRLLACIVIWAVCCLAWVARPWLGPARTAGQSAVAAQAAICPLGKTTFLCVLLMGDVRNLPDEMREARVGQP